MIHLCIIMHCEINYAYISGNSASLVDAIQKGNRINIGNLSKKILMLKIILEKRDS